MNAVLENIFSRRSTRKFLKKEISKQDLKTLVDCARFAPSAMNRQLCKFTVLQNKDMMKKLADAIGKQLGREGYDFYCPDALILVSNERTNAHAVEDCACALENIFLGAHSMGIGSVWINQLKGICDEPEIRAVLNELKLPAEHLVWGIAALGYTDAPSQNGAVKREDCVEYIL
ncbi:MAG: nitroreductase family protein [Ruminococcaceae bacterium]|nr:nitroreductase family protein [Oscillospiraceae bacterium]